MTLVWEAHSTLSRSSLCSFHGLRIQSDISYLLSPMRLSEKTKRVTLGYPFRLTAEGFCPWGLWFTHAASCAIGERLDTSLVPPPIDGNVASCPKPFHRFLIIYKLYLLWETNKKQSIWWKILSTLYPPNLPLLPLNLPEFPWWTPNGWSAKHFVLWDGVCPWVCERPHCCWVAGQ